MKQRSKGLGMTANGLGMRLGIIRPGWPGTMTVRYWPGSVAIGMKN